MVDNLQEVFQRASERFLDQITSSDEEIAVEFQETSRDSKGQSSSSQSSTSVIAKRKTKEPPPVTGQKRKSTSSSQQAEKRQSRERSPSVASSKKSDVTENLEKVKVEKKTRNKSQPPAKNVKNTRSSVKADVKNAKHPKKGKKEKSPSPVRRSKSPSWPPSSPENDSQGSESEHELTKVKEKRKHWKEVFKDKKNNKKEEVKEKEVLKVKEDNKPKEKNSKLRETIEKLKAKNDLSEDFPIKTGNKTGDKKGKVKEDVKEDKEEKKVDKKVEKNEVKTAKSEPKVVKTDQKSPKNDSKVIKTDPKPIKNEPKVVKSDPKVAKPDTKLVKSDPKVKPEPKPLKIDPKAVKNDPKPVKLDPKTAKLDPKTVKNDPKPVKKILNKTVKPKPASKDPIKQVKKCEFDFDEESSDKDEEKDKKVAKKPVKKPIAVKSVADIDALAAATEQTLKDINKWLDDTPRFSEFSSASNSPSHFIGADESDAVGAKIEQDYRKNLKLDKPRGKDGQKDLFKRRLAQLKDSKMPRRREVQRTIDRLQPGKSKGNLLSNMQNTNKPEELFPLGPLSKLRESKNSLVTKTDDNGPKLSLGTVLDSFGQHNFSEESEKITTEKIENDSDSKEDPKPDSDSPKPETNSEEAKTDEVAPKKVEKEVEKTKTEPVPAKKEKNASATPNLSAWFKAFGAPKMQPPQKKKVDEPDTKEAEVPAQEVAKPVEVKPQEEPKKVVSPEPDSPAGLGQPTRQRRGSTGSSISERSSFSQDMDSSPRMTMDERLGAYPAPYPSPLHRSPVSASPVMASPRPEEAPRAPYPALNGSIRVGFYQDTVSTKSSPDKSCSPREPRSPYQQFSEHVYTPPSTLQQGATFPYTSNPYYTQNPPSYASTNPPPAYTERVNPPSYTDRANPPNYTERSNPPTYYDTTKPLTDQYNAKVPGFQEEVIPSPENKEESVESQFRQRPEKQTTMFPVKKRLYNESDNLNNVNLASTLRDELEIQPETRESAFTNRGLEAGLISGRQLNLGIGGQQLSPNVQNMSPREKQFTQEVDQSSNSSYTRPESRDLNIAINKPFDPMKMYNAQVEMAQRAEMNQRVDLAQQRPDMGQQRVDMAQQRVDLTQQMVDLTQDRDVTEPRIDLTHTRDLNQQRMDLTQPRVDINQQRVDLSQQRVDMTQQRAEMTQQRSEMNQQRMNQERIDLTQPRIDLTQQRSEMTQRVDLAQQRVEMTQQRDLRSEMNQQRIDLTQQRSEMNQQRIDLTQDRDIDVPMQIPHSQGLQNMPTNMRTMNFSQATQEVLNMPNSFDSLNMTRNVDVNQRQETPDRTKFDMKLGMGYINAGNVDLTRTSQYQAINYPKPSKSGDAHVTNPQPITQNVSNDHMNLSMRYQDARMSHSIAYPTRSEAQTITNSEMLQMSQNQRQNIPNRTMGVDMTGSNYKPSDMTIPRPAFNTANTLGIDQSLGIRGNLANLSHIVDRFPTDDRLLQGLQNTSYYADKSLHMFAKGIPTSNAGTSSLPMFTQPMAYRTDLNQSASNISYNRPIVELQNPQSMLPQSKSPVSQPDVKKGRKRKTKQVASTNEVAVSSAPQGFQSYAGLKNTVSGDSAISLKTASVVPGSAFNFGPTGAGLGLSTWSVPDKEAYGGFLDEYRPTAYNFLAQRTTPEASAEKPARQAHQQNTAPTPSFPFLGHPQPRAPGYPMTNPFMNQAPLMDPNSPLYQQYLHSTGVLHQGLLNPSTAYPPGYHPALSMRQPYDSMTRPSWL